jgi:hypothetical protein
MVRSTTQRSLPSRSRVSCCVWRSGRDASIPELVAVTAAVISAIGEECLWPELAVAASRWNPIHERQQLGDVVAIPGGQRHGQGDIFWNLTQDKIVRAGALLDAVDHVDMPACVSHALILAISSGSSDRGTAVPSNRIITLSMAARVRCRCRCSRQEGRPASAVSSKGSICERKRRMALVRICETLDSDTPITSLISASLMFS